MSPIKSEIYALGMIGLQMLLCLPETLFASLRFNDPETGDEKLDECLTTFEEEHPDLTEIIRMMTSREEEFRYDLKDIGQLN